MNADDFLCRLIRGCIELGLAPDLDVSLDMTPVDYASRALVALSRSPRAEGVFHLVNPSPSSAYRLFDFIVRRGYPLKLVPYEQWRSILEAGVKAGAYEALAPLLGGMPERLPAAAPENFDCSRVVEALRDSSLDCPPVDERLFAHYFDSMLADGVLPMPCRTGPGPNVEAPTSVGDHQ
jgi:thioester reductase-like protein